MGLESWINTNDFLKIGFKKMIVCSHTEDGGRSVAIPVAWGLFWPAMSGQPDGLGLWNKQNPQIRHISISHRMGQIY